MKALGCFFYIILLESVVTNSHLKFITTNEQVPSNFSAAFLVYSDIMVSYTVLLKNYNYSPLWGINYQYVRNQ